MTRMTRNEPPRDAVGRAGVGLVEVIVAMTVLGIVLTSLAALSFTTAQRARQVTDDAYRQAALVQHVNRFMALPYDSIAGRVGCATVTTGNLPHEVCITGTVTGPITTLKIKLTATRLGIEPDSVTFDRVRLAPPSPFGS